ncbi:hypothetical protein NLG97_g862 [Lecanicillium saksenae]|uniref:Uncharacterized protein n=1 Tax=Lecanicillium saksenae TaxID=468837 RepID=A0ACC1R5F6_9HYPO|nr:hypothetical protein NLG97_g862 [Lecanicillium saksenae]
MVTNLEGLLERIVLLSSCAGEQGCLVSDLLASILSLLSISECQPSHDEVFQILDDPHSDPHRTTAIVWKWVVERNDVSVGHDRRYNDATFREILSLAQEPSSVESSRKAPAAEINSETKDGLRLYVSENTMWESLTGHGVDNKRVPRSEWILLQGIASTTSNGILQGDLGRLVGQDKRSVPKRTGCLVEKGYITKRTTLVRGTKTSKLWLKFLAPSAPEESTEGGEAETDITFSRQSLIESLEAVPWHTRWTGESIDFKVLATTIMALCKEWNVMRLQDLKSKLGVLGMTWQMKVVSKICRFLNARGTIQYVAAKLNNRIFKDCIRFNREMNARDWSIFLATGKRTTKSARNSTQDNGEEDTTLSGAPRGGQGFAEPHCSLWSIYTPITALVAQCILESGPEGLTNPQLCAMTIGPSFTRYLAGLTASISSENIQPGNVKHLAIKSERGRPGKSSSLYWYFMDAAGDQSSAQNEILPLKSKTKQKEKEPSLLQAYDFTPLAHTSAGGASTLSELCQRGLSQQKKRGRPKKIKSELQSNPANTLHNEAVLEGGLSTGARESEPDSQIIDIKNIEEAVDGDVLNKGAREEPQEPTVRARGRPRTRGGGQTAQKPSSKTQPPSNRQFKCDKCEGSWKNDVGLKYHLEKSQTPCNPSFKPQLMPTPKKKAKFAANDPQVAQTTKSTGKASISDTSANSRRAGVVTVGGLQNRKGEEYFSSATAASRKKKHRVLEPITGNDDISILSGQAELLSTTAGPPPRQVDPFTKPSTRQSAVDDPVDEIQKRPETSQNLSESRDIVYEEPESHIATPALSPGEPRPATEIIKEVPKRPGPKNSIRQELMDTIVGLLYQYGGALPTGQSLDILVCDKWTSQHHTDDVPSGARIKSVMLQMIREKTIVDQWHAFRAPDGRIGKCQIITIPSIMAFAPETRALVEAIRQIHPAAILPNQIPGVPRAPDNAIMPKEEGEEEEDGEETDAGKPSKCDSKVGGRGRRSLAAGVAILNAPVYAAQIATKRAADSSEFLGSPSGKRRRMAATDAEISQNQQLWPLLEGPPPSNDVPRRIPPPSTGLTLDVLFHDAAKTSEARMPLWTRDNASRCFEHFVKSMAQGGWIEGSTWFSWASYHEASFPARKASQNDRAQFDYFVEKLKGCLNIEIEADYSIQLPTEANSVFINFLGGDTGNHTQMPRLQWNKTEKRQSAAPKAVVRADEEDSGFSSASADEGPELLIPPEKVSHSTAPTIHPTPVASVKRVVLTSRNLTSLPPDVDEQSLPADSQAGVDNNELVAAFVVIRSLLGGVDKVIDWGLLAALFPTVGLPSLRRFWARIRKEKASFLSKATQDFQESFIIAIQNDEITIPDYERPLDYDWKSLIQWAMRHPNQEQIRLPLSREKFHHEFKLEDDNNSIEDWKEKFFHPQSSVYSRFEAATLTAASLTATEAKQVSEAQPALTTVDIARSWIRSLCCTSETEYTPQDVKERFSLLSQDTPQQNNSVLKTAIDQLTRERVICKSKRTPFGGRPYRLNEGYTSVLAKVAHRQKYIDAVAFKNDLDMAFKGSKTMRVPYTLSDGAMMALTNLIASERIRISAPSVPNIPFGFEPGNYESRKYPKSYYHLDLEVEPTQSYLFDDEIEILEVIRQIGPPREGREREIPQWIDFFGKLDEQRWADIFGAVCFAFNTRGVMSVKGICDTVTPILDAFEARLIISWGLKVGVFVRTMEHAQVTLGEWWWLVVQRRGE